MMLAVADAMERGWLGKLVDVEVHLNLVTPWHLFPFLKGMPRVEIAVHSIHYLDTDPRPARQPHRRPRPDDGPSRRPSWRRPAPRR